MSRPTRIVAAALTLAVAGVACAAAPAQAAPITIGAFPTWTMEATGTPGATYTGTATFADAVGFPGTTVTTNSTTVKTPTGQSAWLGDSTGFGQHFGSTRAQPYLYLSPAGTGPSTTTIEFDGPPPAGWGLAVGDIDADFVEVIPRDADGDAMPGSVLNAQDTTGTPLLNYCNNVPKPSSCTGPGPFTDSPYWYENGLTVGGATYMTPVVLGNVLDTFGAYDWFLPTQEVRSVDLVFHVQSGFPIYQLWLAAPTPAATVTGRVVVPNDDPVPPGTSILLENPDDTPVLDIANEPVVIEIQPDGTFEFVTGKGEYELEFVVPEGYDPIPPISLDVVDDEVTVADIELAPTPAEEPDPDPPTDDPGDDETDDPGDPDDPGDDEGVIPAATPADELPATGVEPALPLAATALLLLAGAAVLLRKRSRPVE